jgi:hypothetical protein
VRLPGRLGDEEQCFHTGPLAGDGELHREDSPSPISAVGSSNAAVIVDNAFTNSPKPLPVALEVTKVQRVGR